MKLSILILFLPVLLQAQYDQKQEGFYKKQFDQMSPITGCHDYEGRIFRGGEPDLNQNTWLDRMALEKITYIIDLRKDADLSEEQIAINKNLGYIFLPLTVWDLRQAKKLQLRITHPNQQTLVQEMDSVDATVKVLKLIGDLTKAGHNVFMHCKHGEDRTGTLLGLMRKCDAWKKEFKTYGGTLYPSLNWLYDKVVIRSNEY